MAVPSEVDSSLKGRAGMLLKPYIWFRLKHENGQTMAEYAVVLGVITLAVVGVFTALAGGISGALSSITSII